MEDVMRWVCIEGGYRRVVRDLLCHDTETKVIPVKEEKKYIYNAVESDFILTQGST